MRMRMGDGQARQAELFPTRAYRVQPVPGARPRPPTLWQPDLTVRPRVALRYTLATVSTWYDLLTSTIAPQELIATAQRLHLDAIGVVDQATTLGHTPLARAARATTLHLVYGATLTMADGHPLRLLARNEDGYRNLCRLVSAQASGLRRLPWETLQEYKRGLYLLCGGRQGRLWHDLLAGDARILWTLVKLQALADREDHFVVEVQQDEADGLLERRTLQRLLELVEQAGVRSITTQDVRVIRPSDASRHRLVSAIDHQLSFWAEDARLPVWRAREPSRYALPTAAAWHRRWAGHAQLLEASTAVLTDCDVELLGRKRFPGAHLPAATVYDRLWSRAFGGLKQHYGEVSPTLIQRLTHEVDEVMAQEVGAFLLFASELVERAAQKGIRMVLQGSGTGSLLCYVLGISPVDPLTSAAEALVFERFCGTHRGIGDLPDLDFGVAAGREDEVRAILVEMFGRERVANLAAVTTLRERGALRTAATAFGYDLRRIRALRRKLTLEAPLDRYEQMIVHAAETIAGQPHHLMQHASGVVVADAPLADVYGVGTNEDGPLLLANKDDVEQLQLLKFDLLAWYLLAIYDQVEAAMHADRYPKPDLWQVAGEDHLTGDMLEVADTRCIPYLQSPAMMTLLRALKVRSEADIALALGALRPGASTTRDRLLAAMHGGTATLPGWEVLTPAHQRQIAATLAPSKGAVIFDEDLLRVAHVMGLTLADAERLRKGMTKGPEHARPMLHQLRAAAVRNGWDDAEIKTVLHWFSFIERYTFTRGHAVALAHTAWRVARLAAHYPPQFYAAVLDHLGLGTGGGMYPILTYVVEARRHGIAVQGPSVNSAWHSIADGRAVCCGLLVLQSVVSTATLERIHAEARQRPFASIADLCARVRLTALELERLVRAGALDRFASSRRAARWEIQVAQGRVPLQPSLLSSETWPQPLVVAPESMVERGSEEYETLGFPVSVDHPLELYPAEVAQLRPLGVAQLPQHIGREVVVAGVVVAARRVRASMCRSMAFASICSTDGIAEVTLFEAAATD